MTTDNKSFKHKYNTGFIGFTSSVIALTITHPIDVIKTRYQIQSQINSTPKKVHNIIGDVFKYHNIKGFYKGYFIALPTYPIFYAITFHTKNFIKKIRKNYKLPIFHYDFANKLVDWNISSAIASTFTNPFFVFKTRFQIYRNPSFYNIGCDFINKEGFGGLFKGLRATIINNTKLGFQFPLDSYLKKSFGNIYGFNDINTIISSIISKTCVTSIYYPFDYIRVNQRNSKKLLPIVKFMKQTYKVYGIKGMYRGVFLYNLVSIPNYCTMMLAKDKLETLFPD